MNKTEFLNKRQAIIAEAANLEGEAYAAKMREADMLTSEFNAESAVQTRENVDRMNVRNEREKNLREFLNNRKNGSTFVMKRDAVTGINTTTAAAAIRKHTVGVIDAALDDAVIYTAAGCPVQKGVAGLNDWIYAGSASVSIANELTPLSGGTISLTGKAAVQNRLAVKIIVSNQSIENADIDLLGLVNAKINAAYAEAINFAACSTAKYGANFYGGFADTGKQSGTYASTGFTMANAMAMVGAVAGENFDAKYGCFVMGPADYYALKATPVDTGSGLMVIDADGRLGGFPVFVTNAINRSTVKGTASGHNIGFGLFNLLPCLQHGDARLSIDGASASAADVDGVIVTCNADWSMTNLYPKAFCLYAKAQ